MADQQITIKDASAASKLLLAKVNGDGSVSFYHVEDVAQRAALLAALAPLATAAGQSAGNTSLATIATQTAGLATAAAQSTGNTSLASILTSSNTGNASLVTIANQTANLATAAGQTTGNASLATIATQTAGLATAAAQTTGNTSLASLVTAHTTGNTSLATIATNTSRLTATADGTLSAVGAGSSVVVRGDFNITVAVTNNFVGSYQVERSFDGTTWFPLTAASELMTYSKSQSEIYNEPQASTRYRISLTSVSAGSLTYKISQ